MPDEEEEVTLSEPLAQPAEDGQQIPMRPAFAQPESVVEEQVQPGKPEPFEEASPVSRPVTVKPVTVLKLLSSPQVGGLLSLRGENFAPAVDIHIIDVCDDENYENVDVWTRSDSNGIFSYEIRIMGRGLHTLTVEGQNDAHVTPVETFKL